MTKKIHTSELDFDLIKSNLKAFLQDQEEFTDYDFEGSALSVLLDVLAYNTHYNAIYHNMSVNESFIDSASKRNSVISKANELGYLPISSTSAKAIVNLTISNNNFNAPEFFEIPRYSSFITTIDSTSYTFYNTSNRIAYKSNGQYLFSNLELIEGRLLTYQFTYNPGSRYIIPNPNVDISTIEVIVRENQQSSITETFNKVGSIIDLNETSPIYFTREIENNHHELIFGNGVIGKELSVGNVIEISYLVSNEDIPNGARNFTYNGSVPSGSTVYVSTVKSASGGSQPEDIDSIKWNAPRSYTAQNRLVTAEDYKSIIRSMYSGVQSINVWGGEDNVPPVYGKVFICLLLENKTLTDEIKQEILTNIINPRKNLTTLHEFVEPEYIDIQLNTTVYYNPYLTSLTSNQIESVVRQTVLQYQSDNLDKFDSKFKFSTLSKLIDNSEESISNNITTVRVHYNIPVSYNYANTYNINFRNPIYKSVADISILSTGIYTTDSNKISYIRDIPQSDGSGILELYYYNGVNKIKIKNVGTVDYENGIITISDLEITGLYKTDFKLSIKPKSNDIISFNNQVLSIKDNLLQITPVIESNKPYKFASSRS